MRVFEPGLTTKAMQKQSAHQPFDVEIYIGEYLCGNHNNLSAAELTASSSNSNSNLTMENAFMHYLKCILTFQEFTNCGLQCVCVCVTKSNFQTACTKDDRTEKCYTEHSCTVAQLHIQINNNDRIWFKCILNSVSPANTKRTHARP